jgi:RNA polymerase sigma-70 factor (ECF subfamily)
MTDGEVISASRQSPELFEEIFERHYTSVLRFAAGRLGRDVAGDVAAETFVRAFDRRARFRTDRDSALPWLFGIAVNVMRERRRKAGRRFGAYQRAASLAAGEETRFEAEAAERVDAASRSEDLAWALSELSDEEYQVIMLLAVAEFSYPDISEYLGVPIGTVRSRIHRARRKLRELLEAERPTLGGTPVHEQHT